VELPEAHTHTLQHAGPSQLRHWRSCDGPALANALETLARATMLRTASHVKLH